MNQKLNNKRFNYKLGFFINLHTILLIINYWNK